jgi:tetratricopeptide (TPR) repeat protein
MESPRASSTAFRRMYAEAIAELNKAAPFSGAYVSNVISLLGYNYALWGKRDEAIKRLDELQELSKRRHVPARDIAIIYTGLGEKDQAFKWLRQACEERNGMLVYLKFDPLFKSLRTDPHSPTCSNASDCRSDLKQSEYISSDSSAKGHPVFIRGARVIIPCSTFDGITKL